MLSIYISKNYITLSNLGCSRVGKEKFIFSEVTIKNLDPKKIIICLEPWIKENRLKGASAVICIQSEQVTYRGIKLDNKLSEWKVYHHIQTHFHDYFEADINDFCFDFEWLKEESEDSLSPEITAFAAPKNLIACYASVFESLGLEIKAIDIDRWVLEEILYSFLKNTSTGCEHIGMSIEKNRLWLMELFNTRIVKMEKIDLSEPAYLDIFLSFIKPYRLEKQDIFYFGTSPKIETLKEQIQHLFNLKSWEIELSKAFFQTSDSEVLEVSKKYPVSFAIHYGLRLRHGH